MLAEKLIRAGTWAEVDGGTITLWLDRGGPRN